jgi:hypothetical protein
MGQAQRPRHASGEVHSGEIGTHTLMLMRKQNRVAVRGDGRLPHLCITGHRHPSRARPGVAEFDNRAVQPAKDSSGVELSNTRAVRLRSTIKPLAEDLCMGSLHGSILRLTGTAIDIALITLFSILRKSTIQSASRMNLQRAGQRHDLGEGQLTLPVLDAVQGGGTHPGQPGDDPQRLIPPEAPGSDLVVVHCGGGGSAWLPAGLPIRWIVAVVVGASPRRDSQ